MDNEKPAYNYLEVQKPDALKSLLPVHYHQKKAWMTVDKIKLSSCSSQSYKTSKPNSKIVILPAKHHILPSMLQPLDLGIIQNSNFNSVLARRDQRDSA